MKKFRKEDLSIHHYLRFNVLNEYIETDYNVSLTYLNNVSVSGSYVYEASSSRIPLPTSFGRGWVYLDAYGDTTQQSGCVTVYDSGGSVISGSEYRIDYVDGRIITGSTTVVPATVTYKYFYVSLVNEWEDIQAADAPVVVLQLDSFTKEGFQLGGGKRVPRRGRCHIFASDRAERDDIMELIYDGLFNKSCPSQTWSKGSMLDWDGTFNIDYVYETEPYQSNLHFDNVGARHISPPLFGDVPGTADVYGMLSDLNRYRARIDFEMFYWEEY